MMNIATPFAAATAARLGGSAVRAVSDAASDFAALLGGADSAENNETAATADGFGNGIAGLYQRAASRVRELLGGRSADMPSQIWVEGGRVAETPGLAPEVQSRLNQDPQLTDLLGRLNPSPGKRVLLLGE